MGLTSKMCSECPSFMTGEPDLAPSPVLNGGTHIHSSHGVVFRMRGPSASRSSPSAASRNHEGTADAQPNQEISLAMPPFRRHSNARPRLEISEHGGRPNGL